MRNSNSIVCVSLRLWPWSIQSSININSQNNPPTYNRPFVYIALTNDIYVGWHWIYNLHTVSTENKKNLYIDILVFPRNVDHHKRNNRFLSSWSWNLCWFIVARINLLFTWYAFHAKFEWTIQLSKHAISGHVVVCGHVVHRLDITLNVLVYMLL